MSDNAALWVWAGEDRSIRIGPVIDTDTGLPLDLSSPTLVEWQLKRELNGADPPLLAKSLAAATLRVEAGTTTIDGVDYDAWWIVVPLLAADTGAIPGRYYDDCVVVVGGQRRLARPPARFDIRPVVNQP